MKNFWILFLISAMGFAQDSNKVDAKGKKMVFGKVLMKFLNDLVMKVHLIMERKPGFSNFLMILKKEIL